jgi:hypothetical protein
LARKISISFKETTKDLELYNLLMSMEDKSYEIKQLIKKALKEDDTAKKEIKNEEMNNVNVLDF